MLDVEIKYLESQRENLLKQYGGRFLVIKGEEVTGAFDTLNESARGRGAQTWTGKCSHPPPDRYSPTQVSVPALTSGILNANISHSGSGSSARPDR